MQQAHNEAVDDQYSSETIDPQRWQADGMRNDKGQYIEGSKGNPGGMGSSAGVVAYVKSMTSDCFEMVDLFVTVMRGEKLRNSDFVAGPKERMAAASELLDRAIGKPKQSIEETGDDTAKQVLVLMQKLVDVKSTDGTTETPNAPEGENASAIDRMKRKTP